MPNLNFIILLICIYSLACQETYPLNENGEKPFENNEEDKDETIGDDEYIPWGNDGPIDLPWNDGPNDFPWGNNGPIDLPWNDGPSDFPWNDEPIDFYDNDDDDDDYIPWGNNGLIDFGDMA